MYTIYCSIIKFNLNYCAHTGGHNFEINIKPISKLQNHAPNVVLKTNHTYNLYLYKIYQYVFYC